MRGEHRFKPLRLEDQVMLEDGCAEGIWMEALEKTAVAATP